MTELASRALSQICVLVTDGKHGDCQPEDGSGYYFISAKDVVDGQVNYGPARQITRRDFEETHRRTKLEPEDILITNSGTIGRIAFIRHQDETSRTTFQKSVAIIKPNKAVVVPKYLYYSLLASKNYLVELAGGTAQKNLLLKDLRKFQVKIPSIFAQSRIASLLSAYDDLIENNKRRIAILEKIAEEIYLEWFVRMRFPGHEETKFVKGVPEGWSATRLVDVLELCYGKGLKEEERKPGQYPVYGSSGIVGTHDKPLVDAAPGIIVGRKGNVGSVIWADKMFFPIDTVYYVKATRPMHYLFFLLRQMNFLNNDSAVPGLNRAQAYSNQFFLPPEPLIHRFSELVVPMFELKRNLSEENAVLCNTRDTILPRLISGKLSVEEVLTDQQTPSLLKEPKGHVPEVAHA